MNLPTQTFHRPDFTAVVAGCRPDPEQTCDAEADAERIIERTVAALDIKNVRFDTQCLATVDGEFVEFELPRMFVRVPRNRFADLMATHALEDAVVALRSASVESQRNQEAKHGG